ncbi:MAG: ABC transporter permease subunit [Chloroflexi bacterium]|nr:ABC transporter permease subunit [Chloroflexota bacterium]
MNARSLWNPDRWHALATLQKRERRGLLIGPGLYVTVAIALLASAIVLRNSLQFAADNTVAVMSRPLIVPFYFSMTIAALYLALTATTTVAREREQGVLETLFYGPIDETAYIAGKFVAPLLACAVVALADVAWGLLVAWLSNLYFAPDLLWVAALSVLAGGMLVAFSLLVSTATRSARAAVIVFLLIVVVVAAVQIGYGVVATAVATPEANRANPLLFLRDVLQLLNQVADWVSPFAYLSRGIDALVVGDAAGFASAAALTAAATVLCLALAVRSLQRRGVRP